MFKRLLLLSIIGFISVFLMNSCSDDPSSVNSEPPQLPPAASMEIDFSSLIGGEQPQKTTTQAMDYYIQAVYKAGSLENLIDRNLTYPRELLASAHDTVAELNDEQQWEWRSTIMLDSMEYQSRIVAEQIAASTVNWSVFLSSEQDDLNNYLYYSGTTTDNVQEGVWNINSLANTADEEQAARLNWESEGEENMHLTLEILSSENGNRQDSLDYTINGPEKKIEYYDASNDQMTITQWNIESRAGYIIAPDVNDGEEACWDEDLQDVNCSE